MRTRLLQSIRPALEDITGDISAKKRDDGISVVPLVAGGVDVERLGLDRPAIVLERLVKIVKCRNSHSVRRDRKRGAEPRLLRSEVEEDVPNAVL